MLQKEKYTEKIGCCDARGGQFITGHENWSAAVNNFTDNFIYQQVGYKHNREEIPLDQCETIMKIILAAVKSTYR